MQRRRKTETEREGEREKRTASSSAFGNVKQFSKSGIKNSIAGQNICFLACLSAGFKRDVNIHPPTLKRYNTTSVFFVFFYAHTILLLVKRSLVPPSVRPLMNISEI